MKTYHKRAERRFLTQSSRCGWLVVAAGAVLALVPSPVLAQGGGGGIDEVDRLLGFRAAQPELPDPYEWRNSLEPPRTRGLPVLPHQPGASLETVQQLGAELLDDRLAQSSILALRRQDGPTTVAASAIAIPEPATLVLLAASALLVLRRRHRLGT